MLQLRVVDLDGSLEAQSGILPMHEAQRLPARQWGPQVRLACSFRRFELFEHWIETALGKGDPSITLYGSGDFHHVTLALLRRLHEPFNLLVVDKHPDWMKGVPFLHCGTWLRQATPSSQSPSSVSLRRRARF